VEAGAMVADPVGDPIAVDGILHHLILPNKKTPCFSSKF